MGEIGRLIEKTAASKDSLDDMARLINRLMDYTRNVQIKYVDRHS
jgi:hypothetical protein